jgi:hypothetical protein
MKTEQYILTNGFLQGKLGAQADLVLLFGATKRIKEKGLINMIRAAYPNACIFGCSTAGEIMGTRVLDNSLIVTAVSFSATKVAGAIVKVTDIPYRPATGIDSALEEISRNKGILYDADVVDACLKLFKEKNYIMVLKK